ncbi:uncharacterized protein BKA78DRAFT_123643 [Phyllosticta capitalensis]|uniref:uncharacterized protein n=1 Tax=Phyllosticta capitalensis TaxID=121624 RepID=UPI00313030F0
MIPRAVALPMRTVLRSQALRPHALLTTRLALLQTRSYAAKKRARPSPAVDYAQWKASEDKRRAARPPQPQLYVQYPRSLRSLLDLLPRQWTKIIISVVVAAGLIVLAAVINKVKKALGYGEPPERSDEERKERLEVIEGRLEELPVVKALMAEDGWAELGDRRAGREELREQLERHAEEEEKHKGKGKGGFVGEQLAASKHLLGPRRVWWNAQKDQGVSVGWAGSGVAGWPTVVHGGAIATVLIEAVQMGWERAWEDKFGGAQPTPISHPPRVQPLQLDLTYLAPTRANEFYVLRFAPSPPAIPVERGAETDLSPSKDMTKREADPPRQLAADAEEWTATLEKAEGSKVCVKARIVMPKRETETESAAVVAEVPADARETKGAKKSWWKLWA